MSRARMRRPSAGTVLGGLALIVAVAGNANAFSASKVIVRKGDIAKGAVTAKALAGGAVHAKALAKGAVTAKALGAGSVGSGAIANDAVTSSAIAPGSVYGGALGAVTIHTAPVVDLDQPPEISAWTSSTPVTALCAPGERLLSGGIQFTDPGNGRVGTLTSLPSVNPGANGWVGQITSDSNGAAHAEALAICLK